MRWSIRSQLLVPILTLLLGVVAGSAWLAGASARRAVSGQIEEQIRSIAHSLAEGNYPLTPRVLEQIKGLSGADFVLLGADGQRLTTLPENSGANLPRDIVIAEAHELRLGPAVRIGDEEFLTTAVRLRTPLDRPPATLYILYPESRWRAALWRAIQPSLWLGGLGGVLAIGLAVWVAQRLGRRLQLLLQHTQRIAEGDFAPVPLPLANDELRDLAGSVNHMAQQLAGLQETVKKTERLRLLGQVSGGLVHHLRNGVTGARLAVQVHAGECQTGADREALDVALRQLQLVEERLQRFLHLGREETGARQPCALDTLVKEAIDLLAPRSRHQQVDLRWLAPAVPVWVNADASQLGHLFVNVIGNALEAAGPGGWIEVSLTSERGQAVVNVVDSGPGPPPEVAGRLFDQFVTSKPEGVGLGLAVARQVAEEHGGRIEWRRENDSTCFRIRLPLCEATARIMKNGGNRSSHSKIEEDSANKEGRKAGIE